LNKGIKVFKNEEVQESYSESERENIFETDDSNDHAGDGHADWLFSHDKHGGNRPNVRSAVVGFIKTVWQGSSRFVPHIQQKCKTVGYNPKNLLFLKENNHQQMHNVYYYIRYKNLLHVSTPPGHLQGEQFLYTMAALI
jgi:hypothetical protein